MSNVPTGRLSAFVFVLAVAALSAYALPRLRVGVEITEFLPDAGDPELAELSREVARSDLNRTLTLTLLAPGGAASDDVAASAALRLADLLEGHPEVARVSAGPAASLRRAFYDVYFPSRWGLVPESERGGFFTDEHLRSRARDLRRRLSSPTGTFVREIALTDPWLLFLRHVEALRDAEQGSVRVHRGAFVTDADPPGGASASTGAAEGTGPARTAGVVFVTSAHSPFNGQASAVLLAGIEDAFQQVNAEHGGALQLEQASVHRIAVMSEGRIRSDITRVSTAGSVGVVLLLLLLFWSPRILGLGVVPLVLGSLVAASACQLIFGSVHGLTLAFGATLIGVAIDYVAHYFNHHVLGETDPGASMRRIWPALALGAATTAAGLAGLAWTSFPGIRQMAVFTTVGVLTALLATRVVLPPLMPMRPTPTRAHAAIARVTRRLLTRLEAAPGAVMLLPLAAVAVASVGLPQLRWQDDIRALSEVDAGVAAEDARVRLRVARMEAGRFVVSTGETVEEALQINDRVYATLREPDAGVLGLRSLHTLLPSAASQRASVVAISSQADAAQRTRDAYEAEGFAPGAFESLGETLGELDNGPGVPLVTLERLRQDDAGLGELADRFIVDLGQAPGGTTDQGRVAVLTFLSGLTVPPAELAARVERVPGARFFDQPTFMERAYREFRTRTIELVGLGLCLVFLLIFARYRRVRPSLAAFLPALLAAAATLGVVGLTAQPATLLHVITLLLVLSMGVDYGVFMVEAGRHGDPTESAATVVSLFTAFASTAISFGALALSDQPAMRAMGFTAAVGVSLSLVLAPSAWLLLKDERAAPAPPQ